MYTRDDGVYFLESLTGLRSRSIVRVVQPYVQTMQNGKKLNLKYKLTYSCALNYGRQDCCRRR
jgi:hypothetical protein